MDLQEHIKEVWTADASIYTSIIEKELHNFKRQAWVELILSHAPQRKPLNILDVGTGPGFFPIILSQAGHIVTGIDCTEAMIEEARKNAVKYGVSPELLERDAWDTGFSDNTFDLIVSRNVMWNLARPKDAYLEWSRVLKPDGKILVFDANWNLRFHDEAYAAAYKADEKAYLEKYGRAVHHDADKEKTDLLRERAPLSHHLRPQWDYEVLSAMGFRKINTDFSITEKIWDDEERVKYRSRPMFMLEIEK